MPLPTGVLWDARYLQHDTGPGHPERPERLIALQPVLQKFPQPELIYLTPRAATVEELSLIHDAEYVAQVKKLSGTHTFLDGDTPFSPKSYEAAALAVGGLFEMVDRLFLGEIRNGFAFPRPPGHHAEIHRAMGFCLFNNVALAAEYALRKYSLKKIAIVDYDVHHGNGTQWAFYQRSDVLFLSLHRFPFYPGTGAATETGKGAGIGYTVNLPMEEGEGDEEYLKAFDANVLPALRAYAPELILVSAGFDAHRLDPLGGMEVTEQGFAAMSQKLLELADTYCHGRCLFVLEGGYSLEGLSRSVQAVLDEMVASTRKFFRNKSTSR